MTDTRPNRHEIRIGYFSDEQIAELKAQAEAIYPTLTFLDEDIDADGNRIIPFLVPTEAAMPD